MEVDLDEGTYNSLEAILQNTVSSNFDMIAFHRKKVEDWETRKTKIEESLVVGDIEKLDWCREMFHNDDWDGHCHLTRLGDNNDEATFNRKYENDDEEKTIHHYFYIRTFNGRTIDDLCDRQFCKDLE